MKKIFKNNNPKKKNTKTPDSRQRRYIYASSRLHKRKHIYIVQPALTHTKPAYPINYFSHKPKSLLMGMY